MPNFSDDELERMTEEWILAPIPKGLTHESAQLGITAVLSRIAVEELRLENARTQMEKSRKHLRHLRHKMETYRVLLGLDQ